MAEKKCNKCREVKALDEFNKNKNYADGFFCWCRECSKEYNRQHYQGNKEHKVQYQNQYRKDNIEAIRKADREWTRKYRRDNPEKMRKLDKKYNTNRRDNLEYVLRTNISSGIYKALTRNAGGKDGESVLKYIPYTIPELKNHLEGLFIEGMSWENYGEWHIDHIYPQSKLPYDNMKHPNFLKAWALENLQPLWAFDNISKKDKVIHG